MNQDLVIRSRAGLVLHALAQNIMSKIKTAEQLLKSHGLLRLSTDTGLAHVTGHRSYVLLGDAARLERSLLMWSMRQLVRHHGFTPVIVPNLIHDDIVSSCGFDPHGLRTQVYTIRGTSPMSSSSSSSSARSICLSGTSEIPLVSMHLGKTFDVDSEYVSEHLPKRYCALSRCYRAETGNAEKPLYRVHYFNKVEMVSLVRDGRESRAMMEEFVSIQESLFTKLGIRYQKVDIKEEDLGPAAVKKIDIEAYLPSRDHHGEISSASDCVDNQCRKLKIQARRLATEEELRQSQSQDPFVTSFAHTVNGTAAATPRILLPIIEQHHDQETGRIRIPDVLKPYMDGREFMMPLNT